MTDITILPVDFSGKASSNYVTGEVQTLVSATNRTNRVVLPKFGAFFTETLVVRDSTGKALTRDTDYVVTYFYKELGFLTAQEICALIVITNTAITGSVRLTYQAFGGPFSLNPDELRAVLDEINNPTTTLEWEDIIDKPLQYTPAPHTHKYWQLYGLESTVENLELLGEAYKTGNKGLLDNGRDYYKGYVDLAQAAVNTYYANIMAHIQDKDNPHKSDKIKIGLGNINNWPMATVDQSKSSTINTVYQPIGGVYSQIQAFAIPALNNHIADKSNPHQVSLDDPLLNLYSTTQIKTIYNGKLAKTSNAANSDRLAGVLANDYYNALRVNLDASNVLAGSKFTLGQIAPMPAGFDTTQYLLAGNSSYVKFTDVFPVTNTTSSNVYFAGISGNLYTRASAVQAITNYVAANRPAEGSWVIGQYLVRFNVGVRSTYLTKYYDPSVVVAVISNGAAVIVMG